MWGGAIPEFASRDRRKPWKKSQDSGSPGTDLNLGYPQYESGIPNILSESLVSHIPLGLY
jgi:hypothetical protein